MTDKGERAMKREFKHKLEGVVQDVADRHYHKVKNSDSLIEIKAAIREAQRATITLASRELARLARESGRRTNV